MPHKSKKVGVVDTDTLVEAIASEARHGAAEVAAAAAATALQVAQRAAQSAEDMQRSLVRHAEAEEQRFTAIELSLRKNTEDTAKILELVRLGKFGARAIKIMASLVAFLVATWIGFMEITVGPHRS